KRVWMLFGERHAPLREERIDDLRDAAVEMTWKRGLLRSGEYTREDRGMGTEMGRRTFVKGSILAGLSLAAGRGQAAETATSPAKPATPAAGQTLPMGKIGDLQISRMLLGGNLLTHFTHSRDLKYVYALCQHYNTEEKIIETLQTAEDNGINALVIHTVPSALAIMRKHRQRGGKMKWIICPTARMVEGLQEFTEMMRQLVDDGTESVYVWGVTADRLAATGKVGLIKEAVEIIKTAGVPAGVGAHDLAVVEECEKAGVANDYYIKTFHHHNYPTAPRPDEIKGAYSEIPGYWCKDPKRTIEVMKAVKKPWIAFKVMAAGAIPPADAFKYVFENGADFALSGMFDYEIATDVRIMNQILAAKPRRERPWMA
ncbi:MAG: hypothetical protein M1457_01660, partial [bacterium]|nr:hypothetical protein [bacterium]